MIKKFCDRCGKEIVGEPWYMKWYQNTMSGLGMGAAMMYSNLCSRADSVDAASQPGAPMYCDECRVAILAFAAKKPEQEEAEVGVSDTEAIDALELVDRYCDSRKCKECVFSGAADKCTVSDGGYSLDEIVRFARDKSRKTHGGKK